MFALSWSIENMLSLVLKVRIKIQAGRDSCSQTESVYVVCMCCKSKHQGAENMHELLAA